MSRIDDLIQDLCPEGVPFVPLHEVLAYEQPTNYLVDSANYDDSYPTPVLTAGQTFLLGYTDEQEGIYEASQQQPVIIFDDFTTASKWVDFPFKVKSSAMKMLTPRADSHPLRFIWYAMQGVRYTPQDHKRRWISTYSKFRIPWPPREVQDEIVRILDTFNALEAELEAELEARRTQYEHYRGQLLRPNQDQNHGVRWLPMKDLGTWYGGGTPSKSKAHYWDQGTIPWVSPKDMGLESIELTSTIDEISEVAVMESSTKLIPPGSVGLVVRSSILDKRLPSAYFPGAVTLNQDLRAISPNQDVLPQYLAHLLRANGTSILRATRKSGGSVASITVPALMKYRVPIPVIQTQKRVVATLSQFDALVNDLNTGLPAEILARRKQYEFYRDRLLSFEEAAA